MPLTNVYKQKPNSWLVGVASVRIDKKAYRLFFSGLFYQLQYLNCKNIVLSFNSVYLLLNYHIILYTM